MITNATNAWMAEPAASPSRPSVRLTALVMPTMKSTASTAHQYGPRSKWKLL